MRQRNYFIAAAVAIITFFLLQAFVRPHVGNRLGWWGYRDHYYYNGGPGRGPDGYYDYRHNWYHHDGRPPYNNPGQREDSSLNDRW
jgi:hypothetical protein